MHRAGRPSTARGAGGPDRPGAGGQLQRPRPSTGLRSPGRPQHRPGAGGPDRTGAGGPVTGREREAQHMARSRRSHITGGPRPQHMSGMSRPRPSTRQGAGGPSQAWRQEAQAQTQASRRRSKPSLSVGPSALGTGKE